MKVSELIEELKQFDGELIVYGMCDHGQTPEIIKSPQIAYTESLRYQLYDDFAIDKEDAEDMEYTREFVIL